MSPAPGRRELILYAAPEGTLAEQCRHYFDRVESELSMTTAQTYPPHVTLTGFFHRLPGRAEEVIAEMGRQIGSAGHAPANAVTVGDLMITEDWVGLPITSPWLVDLTAEIIGAHRLQPGDDSLRQKHRLHLSLAYGDLGVQPSLEPFGRMAKTVIDPATPVHWDVAVWERRTDDGGRISWERHSG